MTIAEQLAAGLLAEDARTASTTAGPCGICQQGIQPGERVARLTGGSQRLAHLTCISRRTRQRRHTEDAR